ncbi:MAG: hypothetical protein ACM31P_17300 [Actinomycetota bacterium]
MGRSRRPSPVLLLPVLLLALARPAWAEPVRLDAPKDIAAALAPHLPTEDLPDPAAREQARRRLGKALPDILAT